MHPATAAVFQYFAYSHLPPDLQETSKRFHDLAQWMTEALPDVPETTVAMRKLLEAKDAAVRAALPVSRTGVAAVARASNAGGSGFVIALLLAAPLLLACGKAPTPKPSPSVAITPVSTPSAAPTSTPKPVVCGLVTAVRSKRLGPPGYARYFADFTPGTGAIDRDFKPLGPEGSSDRTFCEHLAGPYSASINGHQCNGLACDAGGNCLMNGENPLQWVVCPPGGLVTLTTGNGTTATVWVTIP